MPSLIALPPRRTPHDVPAAAPTKASAVIDESTRKPPRDRAVTDRERNQKKTPSTILCVNAPLARIHCESPRESSTRRSALRGKSQGSSPLPTSVLCVPALVCPSAAPSGTAIGGRGLPRCRFEGGGKRRPGDGDRNASCLRGREWWGGSRTGCSEGESTSTDEGRGALRHAPSQACDERPSSRNRAACATEPPPCRMLTAPAMVESRPATLPHPDEQPRIISRRLASGRKLGPANSSAASAIVSCPVDSPPTQPMRVPRAPWMTGTNGVCTASAAGPDPIAC